VVTSFKEEPTILRIATEIYVERVSQRAIIIGHKGENIKKVGIQAREDLEKFFGKKVFLEQFVKVEPDWRVKTDKLRSFGYSLD
jgi:GTP-binding protein Era